MNIKWKHTKHYLIDGKLYASWVIDHGGIDKIINTIKTLIDANYDRFPLAKYFGVVPRTLKTFIDSSLCDTYRFKENENFIKNAKLRRSINQKGKISPYKGKTYKEIYGTNQPGCGFKKGDANPNFTRDKYIGCKLLNKYGEKFRSSYEVKFSEILTDNNISYDYEHRFKLCNGKVKIDDFLINEQFVEVTGYAYDKSKQYFDIKIALLHNSYPEKNIIIVSTKDNENELFEKHGIYAKILSLEESDNIIDYFNSSYNNKI